MALLLPPSAAGVTAYFISSRQITMSTQIEESNEAK